MNPLVVFALLNICLLLYPICGQNTGLAQPSLLLPVCSTDCPSNKRCVKDNVTVVWELFSSKECKSYLSCYGPASDYPDDTTTNIFAGRFYPIVIALGSSVYFEARYTDELLKPFKVYNVSRGVFLACRNATQVVATLTSPHKVPNRFVSKPGYKFFIATAKGKYLPCNLALRLHLNVKNATNCSGVATLPPGGKLCSRKGRCISESFTGGMYCECCPGYTGQFCEELDACYAKPCQRGNCSDVIAGHNDAFNCTCEVGYTGHACDIDIDECTALNVVCKNGGFCNDGVNSYSCLCLSGFHGRHCEFVSNMCELIKPCKNNGNCSRVGSFKHSYVCHCAPGFYGQNCTLNSTTSSLTPQLSSILKTSSYQTTSVKTIMFSYSSSYQVTFSSSLASVVSSASSFNSVRQFYSSMKSNPLSDSTTKLRASGYTTVASSATSSYHLSAYSIDHTLALDTVTSRSNLPRLTQSKSMKSEVLLASPSSTNDLKISRSMSESSSIHYQSLTTSKLSSTVSMTTNLKKSSKGVLLTPTSTAAPTPAVSPSHQLVSPSTKSSITMTTILVTHSVSKLSPTPSSVIQGSTHHLPSSAHVSPSVTMVAPSSIVPTQTPYENQTCADLPCGDHGVCTTGASSSSGLPFQCDCQYPTVGPVCTTDLELHFPYFNGNSYIKYKPISFGSSVNEFIISFRTRVHGTILFSGHRTYRDFIKLEVTGGLLKFSVDAGDKTVSVTSQENVANGNTTAANFGYDTRTGSVFMAVNDGVEQRSTTRGKLRDVQLYYPLYLGGIVPALYTQSKPDVGKITPFIGCVRELEFNERAFELSDAVDWQNISECDVPACRAKPCKNGGVCIQNNEDLTEYSCQCSYPFSGKNCEEKYACEVNVCNGGKCLNTSSSGVECLCPFGRGGVSCRKDVDVSIPTFSVIKNHSSYLQYLTPRTAVNQLDIRMEIKLSNDTQARGSGLLFYVGLHDHLSVGSDGDYLALGVLNNRVVLQFNLGSGGTSITSESELSSNEKWTTILAGRKGRDGYLYVDNDVKEGSSPPPLVGLNVFGHLFLGGVPEFSMLNSEVLFTEGFRGTIKDPKVRTGISNTWLSLSMEHSTNVSHVVTVVQGLNIQDQKVNACVVGACMNNGTCQSLGASYVCRCLPMFSGMTCNDTSVPCRDYNPCQGRSTCRMRDSGFTCDCPPGKAGRYCENDINITTPYFGEYSYLSFSLGKIKIHSQTSLSIDFSTSTTSGILFYITRDLTSDSGDFLSITLHERYVYLIYNLGTGIAKCRSPNKILSDQNNNIIVTRDTRTSNLEVNGNHTSCTSRGGATQLNVASVLYLGGVPDLAQVQPMAYENSRDLRDFTGCVRQLTINGHSFDFTLHGLFGGRNIVNCGTSQVQA